MTFSPCRWIGLSEPGAPWDEPQSEAVAPRCCCRLTEKSVECRLLREEKCVLVPVPDSASHITVLHGRSYEQTHNADSLLGDSGAPD